MVDVLMTPIFEDWLNHLKDRQGRLRILARIDRMRTGNLGDVKAVGSGVYELRFTHGPGYRLYFLKDGKRMVLLLIGGDKSTQVRDINTAKQLALEWKRSEGGLGGK
ncbi:MAG: type II toxin-antitoxin system RelE/ParE family toxin [Actinomycetaceae bacterium]|nr:type II toxin-antitoxin system RelE/ParE family toxin [Actinomycetaceae bacterium]